MYLNENNLHGWGMSGYLPYSRFKWLKKVANLYVYSISENRSIGYILEVDLEYPDELHNDSPLAPEKLATHMICCQIIVKKTADKYGIKVGDVEKLVPNLGNYVLYYRNLQLHLLLWIKLTKIHKILKSKQSDWMKIYIDFNSEKRINSANSFEKGFLVIDD